MSGGPGGSRSGSYCAQLGSQKRLLADPFEKTVLVLVPNGSERTKVICSRCWSPYHFAGLPKPTGSLLSCGAHLALPQLARGRGHRDACCAGKCMAVPPQRPRLQAPAGAYVQFSSWICLFHVRRSEKICEARLGLAAVRSKFGGARHLGAYGT